MNEYLAGFGGGDWGLLAARGAGSHEAAMGEAQRIAATQSLDMMQIHREWQKNLAEEQIKNYREETAEARRWTAAQLGQVNTDMSGMYNNLLKQLTIPGVSQGAAQGAADILGAMQEATSLGAVKKLADLM